jgi:hypothetical protein
MLIPIQAIPDDGNLNITEWRSAQAEMKLYFYFICTFGTASNGPWNQSITHPHVESMKAVSSFTLLPHAVLKLVCSSCN